LAIYDRLQAVLREQLSSDELERLIVEGAGLGDDEVVAGLSSTAPPNVSACPTPRREN
jgi:hypothetical protein